MLYSMGGGSSRAEGDLAPLGLSTAITWGSPHDQAGEPPREHPRHRKTLINSRQSLYNVWTSSFCMDATTIIHKQTVGGISSKQHRTWAQTRRVVKVC
jgi:hypothetical protein